MHCHQLLGTEISNRNGRYPYLKTPEEIMKYN